MTTADDLDAARDRWKRVEALYLQMLTRPSAERAAALQAACTGDPQLAAEVQSLLDAPESGPGLLAAPLPALAAQLEVGEPGSLSGRRVGHFEVQGLLGAGGMGEVYRGRDARLGRAVAIKVLPTLFTSNPDRLARFEREARVLASLSHPNIATLYGLEEGEGVRALVLELVPGQTLAARIAAKALPLAEALAIAKQIAEGLDAAHGKGIVHRDLKPANIMLTPDGVTKVLDFGLAKLTTADSADPELSRLPTATSGGTRDGAILGTTAYMSPEQARGMPVDKRTDIWAFGCILYELLTGSPAFQGATPADTTAAILEHEPAWEALPSATPPHIRRLLNACLSKDPRHRLRDIGDAVRELAFGPMERDSVRASRRGPIRFIAGVMLIAASLVVIALGLGRLDLKGAPPIRRLSEMYLPAGFGMPAISPDGRLLAHVAPGGDSVEVLWVRPLDSLESVMLPGTEGGRLPFWSPDSRWIGFFAGHKLKKIEAKGGRVVVLADVIGCAGAAGGTWNEEGTIVFGSQGLRRVPAAGGDATPLTELDPTLEEKCHAWPSFLPDGRHFLYLRQTSNTEIRGAYIGSLDSATKIPLLKGNSAAVYADPGFILFAKGGNLMARPFDALSFTLTGEAVPLAENVKRLGAGGVSLGVSDEGTLAYQIEPAPPLRAWVWMDRAGKPAGTPVAMRSDGSVRLSADGKHVAFAEVAMDRAKSSLWVYDIDRGARTKLTTDASVNHSPVWSPDGSRLVFDSDGGPDGRHAMYESASNGATPVRPLLRPPPGADVNALDWSRDGKHVLYYHSKIERGPRELWVLPRYDNVRPFPFLTGAFNDLEAALSPDGRWLAYTSMEAGTLQVVARSFPDPSSEKRQISIGGGATPRWRADGKELYYLDPQGRIVAVTIASDRGLVVGNAVPLFTTPLLFPVAGRGSLQSYDVTPDGLRFLISTPPEAAPTRVIVVPDWAAGLKQD